MWVHLGATAARGALARTGVQPDWVDHVVFGNVQHSSVDAHYGGRHVGLKAGVPIEVPALTVNRLCGSRIQAVLCGATLGTAFAIPFRIAVDGERLAPGRHRLDVEVTNLMANRIRCLDRQGVAWRRFYDINFVSIRYQPFDASGWQPRESGLHGPVSLIPARLLRPE